MDANEVIDRGGATILSLASLLRPDSRFVFVDDMNPRWQESSVRFREQRGLCVPGASPPEWQGVRRGHRG